MKNEALKNKMFKKGIKYAGKSKQYIYTRVTICIDNDTTSHTFYLTPDMNQVVSFKANWQQVGIPIAPQQKSPDEV